MMSEELKPCPFCGNSPLNKTIPPFNYSIGCGCGARGPNNSDESEAIAAWNHRPAPVDGVEALKELAVKYRKQADDYASGDQQGRAVRCDDHAIGVEAAIEVIKSSSLQSSTAQSTGIVDELLKFMAHLDTDIDAGHVSFDNDETGEAYQKLSIAAKALKGGS